MEHPVPQFIYEYAHSDFYRKRSVTDNILKHMQFRHILHNIHTYKHEFT